MINDANEKSHTTSQNESEKWWSDWKGKKKKNSTTTKQLFEKRKKSSEQGKELRLIKLTENDKTGP